MRNPIGRPTAYDPSYCEKVVEWGSLGKSKAQIASMLGVTRKTLYNWAEAHDDFLHALEQSQENALNWWETIAQTHMIEEPGAAKLNSSVWSRSMAARFPADYTEMSKKEITGNVAVTQVTRRIVDPKADGA